MWQYSRMNIQSNFLLMRRPLGVAGVVLLALLFALLSVGCASSPSGSAAPAEPLEISVFENGPVVMYEPSRAYEGEYHITWSLKPKPEYPPREQDKAVTRTADEDLEYEVVGFEGPGFYYVRVAAVTGGGTVYSDELQLYLAGGNH